MYFVLYDRNFKSIGESYLLESWSRIQRALDFDDMSIVGEKIPYSAEPFLVVVNDRQGKLQFSGLASTPMIDDQNQKTSITLKDYTTLWNTEILFTYAQLNTYGSDLNLTNVLDELYVSWGEQTDIGFDVHWDPDNLSHIPWDHDLFSLEDMSSAELEVINLHDTIYELMQYYNFYVVPVLDVYLKRLTFMFYPISDNDVTTIRLRDFGIPKIEKEFGDFNRVSIYSHDRREWSYWALTKDNKIVNWFKADQDLLLYPAKQHIFMAEKPSEDLTQQQAMWNATYEAVMALAANRYQINIDLDFQQYSSILDASRLDFSTTVAVYTDEGFYKNLPVGEIETDSNGKHIIRLGYRVQDLTQEI